MDCFNPFSTRMKWCVRWIYQIAQRQHLIAASSARRRRNHAPPLNYHVPLISRTISWRISLENIADTSNGTEGVKMNLHWPTEWKIMGPLAPPWLLKIGAILQIYGQRVTVPNNLCSRIIRDSSLAKQLICYHAEFRPTMIFISSFLFGVLFPWSRWCFLLCG